MNAVMVFPLALVRFHAASVSLDVMVFPSAVSPALV